MQYTGRYRSPLGNILLAADDTGLTGLWFEGQKDFARSLSGAHEAREIPLFGGCEALAGCLFFRAGAGLHAAAAPDRDGV